MTCHTGYILHVTEKGQQNVCSRAARKTYQRLLPLTLAKTWRPAPGVIAAQDADVIPQLAAHLQETETNASV